MTWLSIGSLMDGGTRWQDEAACRYVDPEVFFPMEREWGRQQDQAVKICWEKCPVRAECEQHALTTPETHGIWGGRTAKKLRYMRAERGMAKAPASEYTHGYTGYSNHGCRCDVCREAKANARRRRKATHGCRCDVCREVRTSRGY